MLHALRTLPLPLSGDSGGTPLAEPLVPVFPSGRSLECRKIFPTRENYYGVGAEARGFGIRQLLLRKSWRKEQDSNLRGIAAWTLSRRLESTTLPSFQVNCILSHLAVGVRFELTVP